MKTSLKNLMGVSFGKVDKLAFTVNGLGFRDKDGNVSVYDKTAKGIVKVPADFVIGDFPVYAIPAAENTLKEGDLVMHNDFLKVYLGKNEDGTHKAINVKTQEVQTLVPTKNLFGFGVFAKVLSVFGDGFGALGGASGTAGALDQNTMLMFALMGDKDEDGDEDGDGIDPMVLMAMSGGLGGGASGGMNPFVMAMLLKGKL